MLAFSEDPQVRKFLKLYRSMTKDEQDHLPMEIACLASKVSPSHILGQIVVHARDATKMESALVLMMKNPQVIRAAAAYGTGYVDNFKDREMILKATQTLPTPKGGGINIFVGDKTDDDFEDVPPEESSMEEDVFNYNHKAIDGWGDRRRQLMDEEKKR